MHQAPPYSSRPQGHASSGADVNYDPNSWQTRQMPSPLLYSLTASFHTHFFEEKE